MKSSVLLNVVLALALVVVSVRLAVSSHKQENEADSSEIVYQNIMSRTSVRSYTDSPVEEDKVEKLLRAGMAAPSAMNTQPWHFVVVKDKSLLAQIAEATPNAGMAKDAPLAIVVCGDLQKEKEGWVRDFWIQDVSAVSENILLQANAMGLGAVWTGTYPSEERCAAISRLLHLPEHIVPFSTLVIGYPKGEPVPKDKWKPENVSYESFGRSADGDKVKALGLHTRFTEHGTPYFEEAKTVFECEMIYHAPFQPEGFGEMPRAFYENYTAGIHSMYMGKIVKAMRK